MHLLISKIKIITDKFVSLYQSEIKFGCTCHLHPNAVTCYMPNVICHLLNLICHLSNVICHLSNVNCHQSKVIYHLSNRAWSEPIKTRYRINKIHQWAQNRKIKWNYYMECVYEENYRKTCWEKRSHYFNYHIFLKWRRKSSLWGTWCLQ